MICRLVCYFGIPLSYCSLVWAQNFRLQLLTNCDFSKNAAESLIFKQEIPIPVLYFNKTPYLLAQIFK